jgi:hypothetical protein
VQVGDEALAGNEEEIQIKTFPPVSTERTINFKGWYLIIYNAQTDHIETTIDNTTGGRTRTTVSEPYTVPAGYFVHVRGCIVSFSKN